VYKISTSFVSDNHLFSIIIPNYNGDAVIKRCLQSVISDTKNLNCEIIVIDNGSSDRSVDIINELSSNDSRVRLLKLNKNFGYSGACYMGYKLSKGDFIVLLSNDTEVAQGWLIGLVNRLISCEGKVGAVQSKLLLMDYPTKIDSAGHVVDRLLFLRPTGYLEDDLGQYDHDREVCVLQVVSCLLKRDVIRDVGGLFDPIYFTIHEDTDLSIRLLLSGYKIVASSESVVYHKRSWTIHNYPPELMVYLTRRNAIMTIIRNYQARYAIVYSCLSVVFNIFMMGWYLVSSQGSSALAIIKAFFWNMRNFREILDKRAFIQQNIRHVNDNAAFKSFDPVSLSRLVKFRKYGNLLTVHLKPKSV
jgi:GT2 family glycosyltransferase